jgi:hypothetical protein
MKVMVIEEIFDVARVRAARTFPMLLLLLGLIFMHGACAAAAIASDADGTQIPASKVTEPAVPGPHHDGHNSDHAPCCHLAAGDECVALSVASFLLLLMVSFGGWPIRFGISVSRGLRWARPGLRAGPPGGMPRLALCVIRI